MASIFSAIMADEMSSKPRMYTYDWQRYYTARPSFAPKDTLMQALAHIHEQGVTTPLVVDIGAGTGVESRWLLEQGAHVYAIEPHEAGIIALQALAKEYPGQLEAIHARAEAAHLPSACHVVHAGCVFPFCAQDEVETILKHAFAALVPGGWLSTQLFGPEDSWARSGAALGHTYEQVHTILAQFQPLQITEQNETGADATGQPKHWHIWHILAQKPLN